MNPVQHTQALLAQAGWVGSLAAELVRDAAAAEDLAQETLLAAYQRPPRDPSALRAYLRSVLRNLSRRGARDADRRIAREKRSARPEALPSAAETAERFATHRELVAAVEALPEPYHSTILLRHFEDLRPRAIAARLGVPVKTVDTRLARGHALLRERLDADHGGDRRAWAAVLLRCFPDAWSGGGARPSSVSPATWLGVGAVAAGMVALAIFMHGRADPAPRVAQDARDSNRAGAGDLAKLGYVGTPGDRAPISPPPARGFLRGRVHTSADAPIAGASIEVRFRPADGWGLRLGSFGSAEEVLGKTTSDGDGAFSIEVPAGRLVDVRARAAGFGIAHRPLVDVANDLDILLDSAATLATTVLDAEGAPVIDAHVKLFSSKDLRGSLFADEALVQGATDSAGQWRTTELPPGVFRIEVQSARFPTLRASNVALHTGDVVERVLRIPPSALVTGTVRDAATGEAVVGASIRIEPPGRPTEAPVRGVTDDQGSFRVEGLDVRPPNAVVMVSKAGFALADSRIDTRKTAPRHVDVELRRGHGVQGKLRLPGGAPAAGAWVVAYGHVEGPEITPTDWVESRSDARGAFVLESLRSDLPHALLVRCPGFGTLVRGLPSIADGASTDLGEIAVPKGTSIAGRAVRDDGNPAAGALLHFIPFESSGPKREPTLVITVNGGPKSEPSPMGPMDAMVLLGRDGIAGEDGTFRIFDLVPGKYAGAARIGFLRTQPVEVVPAMEGDEPSVRLEIPRGLAIEGSVTDDGGRPLAGAWLLLFEQDERLEMRSEETDVDGRFRIEGLESKTYRLTAGRATSGAGGAEESFARVDVDGLVPPRLDVVVRLPRRVPVQGRVVDEAGRPLARAIVDVVDGERRDYQAISDDDGRFRLEVAAGARLDVHGSWPGPGADPGDGRRRVGKLAGVAAGAREVVLTLDAGR